MEKHEYKSPSSRHLLFFFIMQLLEPLFWFPGKQLLAGHQLLDINFKFTSFLLDMTLL